MMWLAFARAHNQTGHLLGYGNLGMAIILYFVIFVEAAKSLGAFKIGIVRKTNLVIGTIMSLAITDALEIFVSMLITGQFRFFPLLLREFFCLWLLQGIVLSLTVVLMAIIYKNVFPPLQIIEIYGDHQNNLQSKMNARQDKYKVCKLINYREDIRLIYSELKKYDAVLLNDIPSQEKNKILKYCFEMNKRIYFVPKIGDIIVKASHELNLFDTPLFYCRNLGLTKRQRITKRLFDLLLSLLAVILLSPLLIVIAIAIKVEDRGPVFYKQERVTENGKRFMIVKFRSMIVDAEKDNKPHPAETNDPRITRVGSFIRKTRIDELPQLLNIIAGDMSIVGPRPERWEHVESYERIIPEFNYRLKVKGGLTGYAQVYGKYNTSALDKLKLDLIYIENYNFLLDLQIIFETIKVIFQKESTEGFSEDDVMSLHDESNSESE